MAGLTKGVRSFSFILPEFLGILVLVGILLAVIQPPVIAKLVGERSSWLGVTMAAVVGAITLIPGFVAFPLAAMMHKSGMGTMQLAAFISSLMMVGVVTLPVESKFFGTKLAVVRNLLAFGFSFLIAWLMGWILT